MQPSNYAKNDYTPYQTFGLSHDPFYGDLARGNRAPHSTSRVSSLASNSTSTNTVVASSRSNSQSTTNPPSKGLLTLDDREHDNTELLAELRVVKAERDAALSKLAKVAELSRGAGGVHAVTGLDMSDFGEDDPELSDDEHEEYGTSKPQVNG